MQFISHYFDNYRLADVTDDMIEHAQQKLKVTLPESYINLMKQQDGGELHTKTSRNW